MRHYKPMEKRKAGVVSFNLTHAEKSALQQAAREAGMPLAEYVRGKLFEAKPKEENHESH